MRLSRCSFFSEFKYIYIQIRISRDIEAPVYVITIILFFNNNR